MTQKKYKILKQIIDGRTSKKNIFEEEQLMVAAVSILIEKDNPNYPIYMIKRADEGKHALEWAFPGGKMETTDLNLKHTATRETNEEIGADIKDFENDMMKRDVRKMLTIIARPKSQYFFAI